MAGVKGLNKVLANFRKRVKVNEEGVKTGLLEAALIVKADSLRETPIDTGNLRGSCFVRVTDGKPDNTSPNFVGKDKTTASIGHSAAIDESESIVQGHRGYYTGIIAYSAYYALFVHEMDANFTRGSKQYLLKSMLKNRNRIKNSIKKWASK